MRITAKGQVTIPREIRNSLGLLPNTEVEFQIAQGQVVILRKSNQVGLRGKELLKKMRGKATTRMTTDEIMALTRG